MSQPHQFDQHKPKMLSPRELLTRLEFGDLLLIFYLLVFVRPWFWGVENAVAWCLTIPIALACAYFYAAAKEPVSEPPSPSFWLIVALPLFFAFAVRAPFPDSSFDVWSLRLLHGERGLRGFIYHPGEFFPSSAPFNPAPDMLTGIFRQLLGYRLGTILNLLVLVWAGTILDKILRPYIRHSALRAVSVLVIIWTEHILFEINNYMVDLLALPLVLEATWLVIGSSESKLRRGVILRTTFLLSASVTLKLSNAALAAPLVLVCAWQLLSARPKMTALARIIFESLVVFALPLLPFMIWVYRLTGSPVFPIYNGIFKSGFFPLSNGWDGRWGGFGLVEILTWPVIMYLAPNRTAEISVYSGRLSFAFLVAIACLLLWRWMDHRVRMFSFIIALGSILWSLSMGYIRYGLYLEIMSGVLLIYLGWSILGQYSGRAVSWRVALATGIFSVTIAQSILATRYVSKEEWSMRPTVFQQPGYFVDESRYLFRDRSIRQWMSEEDRAKFEKIDVWIVSGSKTAGLMPFLNDRAPMLGVRSPQIFSMEASHREFARTLNSFEGRQMYSLANPDDYDESLAALRTVGLAGDPKETIVLPIFAPSHTVILYLFQVTRSK